MLGLGIFRKKPTVKEQPDDDTLQAVFDLIDKSSTPVSGRTVFQLAHLDSTDIDECLQKLVAKDWIELAFVKRGLDGIERPFYRVSERYNLMDVKDKVGSFITSIVRKAKPLVDNDHNYHVKVADHKELNMVFDVRQDARDYKRLLRGSRMKLNPEIWEQRFEDGLQVEERKIS